MLKSRQVTLPASKIRYAMHALAMIEALETVQRRQSYILGNMVTVLDVSIC